MGDFAPVSGVHPQPVPGIPFLYVRAAAPLSNARQHRFSKNRLETQWPRFSGDISPVRTVNLNKGQRLNICIGLTHHGRRRGG